jgi:hypothetical protein
VRLRCCRWMYVCGYELGGRSLQLNRAMLNDWLCDGRDVIVEEEIIRACSLSEWIYRRVVVGGGVGRGDGLESCQSSSFCTLDRRAEEERQG